MAPIQALIFDLGGVIVDVDLMSACRRLAQHADRTAEEIHDRIVPLQTPLDRGDLSCEEFFARVAGQTGLRLSFAGFSSIYADIFSLKEETAALLHRARGRWPLCLLSNTDPLHFGRIREDLRSTMSVFDHLVLSYEERLVKPERGIYLAAAARLGVPPDHCVFVDDVPTYVEGARQSGLRAVRFQSAHQVEEALLNLGVRLK